MKDDATICAIATAPGMGAIAVLRLSGNDAIAIADSVYRSPNKAKKLTDQPANTLHYGSIEYDGKTLDDAIFALFKQPHSYTGEDVVEITCHGSVYIQQQVLQALTQSGARLAEPGEFTLRAFLNGKMDLSQAEAVADLIASESGAAHKMAMKQMRGGFSAEIGRLREQLLHLCSLLELELDFSEEDVEFADRTALKRLLEEIHNVMAHLTSSFSLGNVIKIGVPVAIVGKPNVGKSTLLNTLLQEEKAIVSEIAGTTRDAIEDVINIKGIRFRFIDTAGIRQTTDTIESLGIERTFSKISEASVVLLLAEAKCSKDEIQQQITALNLTPEQNLVIIINKIDLYNETEIIQKLGGKDAFAPYPVLFLSAKHHLHTNNLHDLLLDTVQSQALQTSDVVVSNARHYEALQNALEASNRALSGLDTSLPSDLIAQDIREILHYLGQITGEITTDEILGNIFKNFCIGK
ncbi:MAG TPA: tRNA uridine-5-carboxymethylaminomethyl(34) synthesis GTPase MnmE [Bacteroidales bacterium]|nr:tRNA uridine-5-carboxymethylaminomethyl(34) synthesis GTPase MnmE [Bacteroidales bacterium]